MRKNFFLISIFIAITAVTLIYSCGSSSGSKSNEVVSDDSAKAAQQMLQHGKYMATNVSMCIDCHSPRDVSKFSLPVVPGTEGSGSGFPFSQSEGVPGMVWAPNITPFALGSWTDEEIARTITTGINKNGDTLFPLMPFHNFSKLTREDIYSIIAYLRTLPSADSVKPKRQLMIPPSMFGPLPVADLDKNVKPDPSDKVNYGRYMITAASCGECHTPRNPQGVPQMDRAFSGGFVFNTPFFKVGVANITPDSATGIGAWTEDAFVQKFKTNSSQEMVNKNPGKFNTIMPWEFYGHMKEEDLRAIYAYLRTVPPVKNKVEKWPK